MKNKTSRKYNCRSERITLTPWGRYATIIDIGGNEIKPIHSFAWVFWGAMLQISYFSTQSSTWITSLKLAMLSARLIELYPIHAAICTRIALAGIIESFFVEWRLAKLLYSNDVLRFNLLWHRWGHHKYEMQQQLINTTLLQEFPKLLGQNLVRHHLKSSEIMRCGILTQLTSWKDLRTGRLVHKM